MTKAELTELAKQLKKLCGSGGAVVDSTIEIQGDQRQKALDFLSTKGIQAKLAGR